MLTITTTVSQPPPVARCGNTRVVVETNDAFGVTLPDFAVVDSRKVGFGDAATGAYQLPCCPRATAAVADTKPKHKIATLIDLMMTFRVVPVVTKGVRRPLLHCTSSTKAFRTAVIFLDGPVFSALAMRWGASASRFLEL